MSEFNDWFCSLQEGRQAVLRDDKWRLADNAFQAGFEQAQAEIDALKAAQTWQPIETAPMDGTRIIIFGSERHNKGLVHGVVSQSYFSGGLWQAGGFTVFEPTHWMPLPPAPETAK